MLTPAAPEPLAEEALGFEGGGRAAVEVGKPAPGDVLGCEGGRRAAVAEDMAA